MTAPSGGFLESSNPSFPLAVPVSGVRVDIDPTRLTDDQLADSLNWHYRRGKLRLRDGCYLEALSTGVTGNVLGFTEFQKNDGTRFQILVTTTDIYKHTPLAAPMLSDPGTWTSLSASLSAGVAPCVFRQFQVSGTNLLLISNAVDVIKKYDGTTLAALGGTPPKAGVMFIAGNRLCLGNLTTGSVTGQNVLTYSDVNNPETGWDTNFVYLDTTPESIIAALELGPSLTAIYKRDEIVNVVAQADITAALRPESNVPGIIGPISRAGVARMPDGRHVYLGRDGALRIYDGTNLTSAGEHIQELLRRYVVGNADAIYSTVVCDWANNEIRIFIPNTSAVAYDFCVNIDDMTIWPFVRAGFDIRGAAFDVKLNNLRIADITGTLGMEVRGSFLDFFAFNAGTSKYSGSTYDSYFTRGVNSAGVPDYYKVIHSISEQFNVNEIVGSLALTIQIGGYYYTDAAAATAFLVLQSLNAASQYYKQTFRQPCRFFQLSPYLRLTYTANAALPVMANSDSVVLYSGGEISVSKQGRR